MTLFLEPVFNNIGYTLPLQHEVDLSEETISGIKAFREKLRVSGSVSNESGVVKYRAQLQTMLSLPCDRCFKALEYPLRLETQHILVTSVNEEETEDMLLLDSMQFDLDRVVSEDLFLSLPSKFLCSEDCKGVCPQCGKDLNEGSCGCQKPIDPRLAVLKELL